MGHGIISKTRPQNASSENRLNYRAFAQLFGQRLNLNVEFHSRHDRELTSFIIMVLGTCLRASLLPY